MAATSVFQRVRTGSKIGAQYDQEGNLIKVTLQLETKYFNTFTFAFASSYIFKVMLHSINQRILPLNLSVKNKCCIKMVCSNCKETHMLL